MSCRECGFCQADLPALENITVDARSRGNYRFATMLDEALERCGILRENLQANNREYLKNISRMVKKQSSSDVCTNLLRDAKQVVETTKGQQQTTLHRGGFANMFAASRGVSSIPTPEQIELELRSSSGFIQMLDESHKRTHEEPVQRALDEIDADEKKYRPTRREAGFGSMLEASRRGTFEGDEEFKPHSETRSGYGFRAMLNGASRGNATGESVETRDDVKPIPCGLVAMLEAMSPTKIREPLNERPRIQRGMGFRAMLDGASRGTE